MPRRTRFRPCQSHPLWVDFTVWFRESLERGESDEVVRTREVYEAFKLHMSTRRPIPVTRAGVGSFMRCMSHVLPWPIRKVTSVRPIGWAGLRWRADDDAVTPT